MESKLFDFEGERPETAEVKITGQMAEKVGTLRRGEEVYFIGRGSVTEVTFKDKSDLFTRIHTVKASALVLITRDEGERMLDEAAMMADERFGVESLFASGEGGEPEAGEDPPLGE